MTHKQKKARNTSEINDKDPYIENLEQKVDQIIKGLWTLNNDEFYVEYEIQNELSTEKNSQKYYRLINQNELAAIKTQLSLYENKVNRQSRVFFDYFKNLSNYLKIVQYLNLQGISRFKIIRRKRYDELQRVFQDNHAQDNHAQDILSFESVYNSCPPPSFFSNYINNYAFRIIGDILQDMKSKGSQLLPYALCILGQSLPTETLNRKVEEFLSKQSMLTLFDKYKLGHQFCLYFSDPTNFSDLNYPVEINNEDINDREIGDFKEKLTTFYDKNNLLFVKVEKPVHCYHCILSITRILSEFNNFYLNEKTLIFCKNGGSFADKIHAIPVTSNKDSNQRNSNLTYFIVHPEMLSEEDHSLLIEFINSRMNLIHEKMIPKVFIISSFNYRDICDKNANEMDNVELKITDKILQFLYDFSFPVFRDKCNYQMYYSDKAGAGKTWKIMNDFKEMTKNQNVPIELKSFFLDVNMESLPKLDENNQTQNYVHFDLSPDLFDNDYRLFDDLWIFLVLRYHINPDGTSTPTPENVFFEVPTLSKEQFPDGDFIKKYDFPIYINKYHQISMNPKEGQEKIGDIELPKKVADLCKEVFNEEIKLTSELLNVAARLFFKEIQLKGEFYPRILHEVNLFLEKFCDNLKENDEVNQQIFLLLIRTNFHIWNMDSVFDETNQPKSFIIMTNANLFSSSEEDPSEWILLGFSPNNDKSKWNTLLLKEDIQRKLVNVEDSNFISSEFFKELQNKKNIRIFSNQLRCEFDQSYFFNIIKSIFYNSTDVSTDYCKITDGVILNDFRIHHLGNYQGNSLNKIGEDEFTYNFPAICDRHTKSTQKQRLDVISELSNNETVKKISRIMLTMSLFKHFIIMIIRVILKQPIIFEGFTGVGKTLNVDLFKMLVDIARQGNKDFKWVFHQIDCHGALQLEEVEEISRKEINKSANIDFNHIFFFDELNTSPVSSYIINEMNNQQNKKKVNNKEIVFIAAINPYLEIDHLTRCLSRVGIKQIIPAQKSCLKLCCKSPENLENIYQVTDINKLAYNVRKLSDSSNMIVLRSDPENFSYQDENIISGKLYPPDESHTVLQIIKNYLNILEDQVNLKDANLITYKNQVFINYIYLLNKRPEDLLCFRYNNHIYMMKDKLIDVFVEKVASDVSYNGKEYVNLDKIKSPEMIKAIYISNNNSTEIKIVDKEKGEQTIKIQEKICININIIKDLKYPEELINKKVLPIVNPCHFNYPIIQNVIENNKEEIANIISSLLSVAFIEIRELMNLKSILSYRDVKRFMQFFIMFFRKHINMFLKEKESQSSKDNANNTTKKGKKSQSSKGNANNTTKKEKEPQSSKDNDNNTTKKEEEESQLFINIIKKEIIPRSIVLSIMITIVFRFSNSSRVEKSDPEDPQLEEEILARCKKFLGTEDLNYLPENQSFTINIYSKLLKKLGTVNWGNQIMEPEEDWFSLVISYSWIKCGKYLYDDKFSVRNDDVSEANASLFKINSLMIHLFAISACYSVSKYDRTCVIPCLIIGMPGTSKTLAIQLFTKYKQTKSRNNKNFFTTTYLSTRISEAESLNSHYKDCAMFMMKNKVSLAVCVIDELGLANLNETRPLKLLHYYFDKGITMTSNYKDESVTVPVMSIAASNYALDYANMNRGILICTDLPTDGELIDAFVLSKLEIVKEDVYSKLKEFKKEYISKYNDAKKKFFFWREKEYKKLSELYKKFLEVLWSLTKKGKRPDMLTLRPLFLLFNSIFHNRTTNNKTYKLCFYIASAISCNPSDSYIKLSKLLDELKLYSQDFNKNGDDSDNSVKFDVDSLRDSCNNKKDANVLMSLKNEGNQELDIKNSSEFLLPILNDYIETIKSEKWFDFVDQASKNRAINVNNSRNYYFNELVGDLINHASQTEEYRKSILIALQKANEILNSLSNYSNTAILTKLYDNAKTKYQKMNEILISIISNERNQIMLHPESGTEYDNFKLLCQNIIENLDGTTKRALCIRTKNYECLDFIENLLSETIHFFLPGQKIMFHYIFPNDFKVPRLISMANEINRIIDIIFSKDSSIDHYILIAGNVALIDALLDLLNTPNENKSNLKTKKPLISQNGFSIQLDEYPANIIFCFIINENDFENHNQSNSIPFPLLDRLNQIYLDYDKRDNFSLIKQAAEFREENSGYTKAFAFIIQDWFMHFVENLDQVQIPEEDDKYAVVFITSENKIFIKSNKVELFNTSSEENKNVIKFNRKIILVETYASLGNANEVEKAKKNIESLHNQFQQRNYKMVCYWSTEYDRLYDLKSKIDFNVPLPDMFDHLSADGSITKLDLRGKQRAIILTLSPMMEELNLENKFDNGLESEVIFESYIRNREDLITRIKRTQGKKNIIVRSNRFQIEQNRNLRHCLEEISSTDEFAKVKFIIVYHLKQNIVDLDKLYTSEKWPAFWIDSITCSPLSKIPIQTVVDCILFENVRKEKYKELYICLMHQIYEDLMVFYSVDINKEIIDDIFETVYDNLKINPSKNIFTDLMNTIKCPDEKSQNFLMLDIKKRFFEILHENIPILNPFIKLLILNCYTINNNDINLTKTFISEFFKNTSLVDVMKLKKIYLQLESGGLYFPELLLSKISKNKNEKTYNCIRLYKSTFTQFYNLQPKKTENIVDDFCQKYMRGYISCTSNAVEENEKFFDDLKEKLNDFLKG